MSTIDVRYDITLDEDPHWNRPLARRALCLLPPWALNEGQETAKTVALEHMRDVWDEHVGEDEDITVLLRINSPPEIAGEYEVTLGKTIVARNCDVVGSADV